MALHEARSARTKVTTAQEILWFAGSTLDRAGVSAVHVHENGTGRLLLTIPLEVAQGPPFVITQVFTRRPYDGSIPWHEFYDLVGNERTYIDVHTGSARDVQLRGVLRRDDSRSWDAFTHAYCS